MMTIAKLSDAYQTGIEPELQLGRSTNFGTNFGAVPGGPATILVLECHEFDDVSRGHSKNKNVITHGACKPYFYGPPP